MGMGSGQAIRGARAERGSSGPGAAVQEQPGEHASGGVGDLTERGG